MSNYVSGRLFASPSFLEGAARILDLGNTLQVYNVSKNEEEADSAALKNDWRAVGSDLRTSILAYEQEQQFTR